MTSHLDDGTIHELLDGEIPSTHLAPLQAHLAACAECRARLNSAREMVDFSDQLVELLDDPPVAEVAPVMVTPLPTPARPWIRQLAWAASIAIAVGAGWYARGDVQQVLPPVRVDSPVTEAISAVPPTSPATSPSSTGAITAPTVGRSVEPTPIVGGRQELAAKATGEVERNRVEPTLQKPAAEAQRLDLRTAQAPAPVAPAIAASGGGLSLPSAEARRAARTIQDNRSDLVPRDQVMTKQLIGEAAATDTVALQLVALQWLLDSSEINGNNQVTAVCIGVSSSTTVGDRPASSSDARDLPDSLRRRLSAGSRSLRPGSACSVSQRAPLPTIETATGRPAVSVLVGTPHFLSPDRALIGTQRREGGRSAGGYRCDLERRNGAWVVVDCKRTWVS